jgi:hypothetical protein
MLQSVNDDQIEILAYLNIIFSSISIVFLVMFILGYILVKSMRTFSNELLMYLCVSELLLNTFSLLNDPDNEVKCKFASFAHIVFPFISLFLGTSIQYTIYCSIIHNINVNNNKKYFRLSNIVSVIIPLIFGIT